MEIVRVYEMPKCKMVSSQSAMFGEGTLERFSEWFLEFPRTMFPQDYLWFDPARGGFVWYYVYSEGMKVPPECEVVDFPGGLYAVATDVDGQDDADAQAAVKAFLAAHPSFVVDASRMHLGNIITSPQGSKGLGYEQMDYYTPIKLAEGP